MCVSRSFLQLTKRIEQGGFAEQKPNSPGESFSPGRLPAPDRKRSLRFPKACGRGSRRCGLFQNRFKLSDLGVYLVDQSREHFFALNGTDDLRAKMGKLFQLFGVLCADVLQIALADFQ